MLEGFQSTNLEVESKIIKKFKLMLKIFHKGDLPLAHSFNLVEEDFVKGYFTFQDFILKSVTFKVNFQRTKIYYFWERSGPMA